MATLTPPEEAEFTIINAAAFDICLVEAKAAGQVPVCWLCMSEEAKQEYRDKLVEWANQNVPNFIPWSEATLAAKIKHLPLAARLAQWKESELTLKQERETGNPKAYFYPIV